VNDQFTVQPAEVTGLATSMAQQRDASTGLADTLASGRGADTGEQALNADLDALATGFMAVFADLTRALDRTSTALAQAASAYQDLDQTMAAEYDRIGSDQGPV
jgi:uncharacterized protein YukE